MGIEDERKRSARSAVYWGVSCQGEDVAPDCHPLFDDAREIRPVYVWRRSEKALKGGKRDVS